MAGFCRGSDFQYENANEWYKNLDSESASELSLANLGFFVSRHWCGVICYPHGALTRFKTVRRCDDRAHPPRQCGWPREHVLFGECCWFTSGSQSPLRTL